MKKIWIIGIAVLITFVGLGSIRMHEYFAPSSVKLYDTRGLDDPQQWQRVKGTRHTFASPEHIVFENEQFRVTYPILSEDQQAGHSYFVKIQRNWVRITSPGYGDYTYFVDSIRKPPERIEIVSNTSEDVTLAFTYQHLNYRQDLEKDPIQQHIRLTKTMSLKKGYPGVFVKIHSVPENPPEEREIGFGVTTPLVFSDNVIAQHPIDGHHIDLNMDAARWPYAVSLPGTNLFYRILVLSRPMQTLSYQFSDEEPGGMLTVRKLWEDNSDIYQVFLGAVPFDSTQSILEFTANDDQTSLDDRATEGRFVRFRASAPSPYVLPINIPLSGQYRIALRCRTYLESTRIAIHFDERPPILFDIPANQGFFSHVVAERYELSAGQHTLKITVERGEAELDNLLLLPIMSPRKDFPLDIVSRVLPLMLKLESPFEAETLFSQTGRNVDDPNASGGAVRMARAQLDAPGFLVFGPYQRIVLPGEYVARFHLKVGDRSVAEEVVALDVSSSLDGVFAEQSLAGTTFRKSNAYQAIDLNFTIAPTYPRQVHKIETHVYFTGRADIAVDYIELIPKKIASQN